MSKCTLSGDDRNSVNAFFNLYFLTFAADLKKTKNKNNKNKDFFIICANKPLMVVHLTFFFFSCIKLERQRFEVTLYDSQYISCPAIQHIQLKGGNGYFHLGFWDCGAQSLESWIQSEVSQAVVIEASLMLGLKVCNACFWPATGANALIVSSM